LLIRQLAAKTMHRAEQHAVRDRHKQFPIGLGPSDLGLKIRRPYDQILAIRAFAVQFAPMATETAFFVHRLPFLGISTDGLPGGPGASQQDQADRTDHAQDFHVANVSLVGGVRHTILYSTDNENRGIGPMDNTVRHAAQQKPIESPPTMGTNYDEVMAIARLGHGRDGIAHPNIGRDGELRAG